MVPDDHDPCVSCGADKGPNSRRHYCKACWDSTDDGTVCDHDKKVANGLCMPCYRRRWERLQPHRKNQDSRRSPEALERRRIAKYRRTVAARYGITLEEHASMVEQQDGCCAICGSPPAHDALAIDHDHETGKVRALLCDTCNFMIGLSRESPALLHIGAAYLEAHRG